MIAVSKCFKSFMAFGVVVVLSLGLFSLEAKAQSDKDKPFFDVQKTEGGIAIEGEQGNKYPFKESANKGEQDRDHNGYKAKTEKELRAEGKSTLSFNLFLFVIDRLKEN